MTEFDSVEYKKLREEFIKVSKRILKDNISTVDDTLRTYRNDIIVVHDALIAYIAHFYPEFDITSKQKYKNELIYIRRKVVACFEKLGFQNFYASNLGF